MGLNMLAQNETIHWYFGNKAALNFDRGRLEILDESAMDASAGSASISSEEGLLLFYSDGETVWNRNHEIMENGSGLAGDKNNFQSAIIIPKPGNDNSYYLFYSRLESATNPLVTAGTFYSEIKFNNDFPFGKVVLKNGFLDGDSPSEKLTAVHHKSGESFWLLTLTAADSDPESLKTVFKAYHITDSGLNTNEVETELDFGIENFGSMKISVDSKKLFVTSNTTDNRIRFVHYFDFNNETGNISFVRNIIIDPPGSNWPPKGLEISPNGQFVYVSFTAGNSNGIMQYEVDGPGAADNPRAIIVFRPNIIIESLQLANDQKIYVALSYDDGDEFNTVGVINNPNGKLLLAEYRQLPTKLDPGSSRKGLPNFVQSYFASKIETKNECYIDPFSFTSESYAPISGAVWDFGDGNSGTGINTTHTYNTPGEYTVKGILSVGSKKVTVYKVVNAYPLPLLTPNQELTECDEDFDGLSLFNLNSIRSKITDPELNEELYFYLSQDDLDNDIQIEDSENFNNTIPNQQIFVKVINENGCFDSTSFSVNSKFVELGAISDIFVCENSDGISGNSEGLIEPSILESSIRNQLNIPNSTTLSFYPNFLDAQTNLNQFTQNFTSKSSTIFMKAKEADFSCGGIQSFNIIVNSESPINIQDSYTICFNPNTKPPVIINADISNDRVEWRNNEGDIISTNNNFTLDRIGEFSLTVFKTENGLLCSNSRNFTVKNPEKPVFLAVNVNTEDETNNIMDIIIEGNSTYEFSLDSINFQGNSTNYTFTNVTSGLRTVYVRDINACEEGIQVNVPVIGFKDFFTPNGDGKNDYWNINGLDTTSFKYINVRVFDRLGKLIFLIKDFDSRGWDGTYNGENLPSNSYWFKAEIIDKDNKMINEVGSFSLIRN